jgi:hypothetical protein
LRGATETEVAHFFGVQRRTIRNWTRHLEFFLALRTETEAGEEAERSLYERATGYEYVRERFYVKEKRVYNRRTKRFARRVIRAIVIRQNVHVPPDVRAAIRWLTTRRPQEWQRNAKPGNASVNIVHVEANERNGGDPAT